jgi:uncharacterized protein with GYD domain
MRSSISVAIEPGASLSAVVSFAAPGCRMLRDRSIRRFGTATIERRTVKDLYWTLGQYDIVLILEAQDDAAVAELGLSLGKLGNVRTQTMRAFGPAEVTKLLDKMV